MNAPNEHRRSFCYYSLAGALAVMLATAGVAWGQSPPRNELPVRITWGHTSPQARAFYVKLIPTSGAEILKARGESLEPGEGLKDGAWQTHAGAGDVDGVSFTVSYPQQAPERRQNIEELWAYLIAQSDPDTARRLLQDAAFWLDPPRFTLQMNAEGTQGFTIAIPQLLEQGAMWVPSLDVYVTAGPTAPAFADYQKELANWKGETVLETIHSSPEATYQEYASLWEDTGNPNSEHPNLPDPGHIVCVTWDSAIPKFGIDRRARVRNDYGNPDQFNFWLSFGDIGEGLKRQWKNQSLTNGLPVVVTDFEKQGLSYRVEQFAYPLNGPPPERRGDIPMVLLQKVTVANPDAEAHTVSISVNEERQLAPYFETKAVTETREGGTVFEVSGSHQVLFTIQGSDHKVLWSGVKQHKERQERVEATVFLSVAAHGSREFVIKLPSPMTEPCDLETLLHIDYDAARAATLKYWSDYVGRGAQFTVPEPVVNDLFRATLWHALRLPRRHGGTGDNIQIDLPYSNFAYTQTGTPWPVNQAVYVDYMLYGLRGYWSIAREEMAAMYRNNQEADGHVNGAANWGSYTPGMLYAVALDYRLSHDRQALDRLMPPTLKALDWCLEQLRRGNQRTGPGQGLFYAPLNDGTGEGAWAFNQAYMFAGLEAFGQVLDEIGHARAKDTLNAARALQQATEREFSRAAMLSPLVQLRDHTWIPYVPAEALTPRRLLEQWYPTDVDTGAVHLIRLEAIPATGPLATALVNDQEDNLFYKGWGIADEPVYVQQAQAYLLRDDPKSVIREFYSFMTSGFSHTALEPLEHRWLHGEYFGPPSTDGAWFDVYRHMLINELSHGTLFIAQATPRPWLEDGKKIEVEHAPTYFGTVSFTLESKAGSGKILATLAMPDRNHPTALKVRFRHPESKPLRAVTVNGQNWTDFDAKQECVRIERPAESHYIIEASY
jgi:hypothetical protein